MILKTNRLELIAGTVELAAAELEDRERLASMLSASVPEDWPPPLNDANTMNWFKAYMESNPNADGWVTWYFILPNAEGGRRIAIGNGGFKGKPSADGTVEVGYSIMEDYQRNGYATEAVGALINWAFSHPEVTRVIAETYPVLKPSMRVMEKNGLVYAGDGSEPGVIRYELRREQHGTAV